MKRVSLYSVLFLLLVWLPLRADTLGNNDTVTLKDGRVLKGQVMAESSSSVVMLLGGVQRSFSRDFISKIGYGKGSEEKGAATALEGGASERYAQAPAEAEGRYPEGPSDGASMVVPEQPHRPDLVAALSRHYQVSVGDVLWVRRQGISDSDLPIVFWVAASARVTLRAVVNLYHQGWSWGDIEGHFHIQQPDAGYDGGDVAPESDDGVVYDPGYDDGPYGWDGWYGDGWGVDYGVGYGGVWYGGGRGNWGHGARGWSHGGGGWSHNASAGSGGRSYVGGGHVGASVSGGGHGFSGRSSGGHVSSGGRER